MRRALRLTFVGLVMFACAATLASAGSADVNHVPTSISAGVAPSSINEGDSVTVSGNLTKTIQGAGRPQQDIHIDRFDGSGCGGSPTASWTIQTSTGTGSFSMSDTPPAGTGAYDAHFDGEQNGNVMLDPSGTAWADVT